MRDYVVVDLETTGLSAKRHKITEIAALKYSDNKLVDEFVTLVNPGVPIPAFITRLTGISDSMVEDKPTLAQVLPHLCEFMSDLPIIAHNASFDYNFLDYSTSKILGKNLANPKVCTAKLARRLLPELPKKNLSSLCSHFEIINESAHRAKADALVTAEIFNIFLDMMAKYGISGVKNIDKFQASKVIKAE